MGDKKLVQQGDVLIFAQQSTPDFSKMKKVTPRGGKFILAEGEVTGHAHRAPATENISAFEDEDGTLWLQVKDEPVTIEHEEHGPVTVDPGTHRIGIVQEVNPWTEAVRNVAD